MSTSEAVGQLRLLPDEPVEFGPMVGVPLDDIAPDEYLAGPVPDGALVTSLRDLGQIDPIVLECAAGEDFGYWVRSGKRRVKAARLLGWELIEARIIEAGGDPVVSAVVELTANAQRRENPLADLAAIEAVQAAAAARGITLGHAAIAKATGLAIPTIKKRLALRHLHPDLRAALDEGRLGMGLAERVAKLPRERQGSVALTEGKITASVVREATRARASAAAAIDFSFLDRGGDGEIAPARDPGAERMRLLIDLCTTAAGRIAALGLTVLAVEEGGEWVVRLPSGATARVLLIVDELPTEEDS